MEELFSFIEPVDSKGPDTFRGTLEEFGGPEEIVVRNLISLVRLNQASLRMIKDPTWYSQHEEQHLTSLTLNVKQPLQKIRSLKEGRLLAQIS
uniref:Uncharacterized protein n=1 Tax=Salix viminalis TaxID=40686 RepID=A0A6N2LS83_SALVM